MKTFEDLIDFRNWLNEYCDLLTLTEFRVKSEGIELVGCLHDKIAELDAIIDDLRYTYE